MTPLPDGRVADAVIEHWKSLSPAVRREAVELLFARPQRQARLIEALEAGAVQPSDLDPARRAALRSQKDAGLRARAEKLLAAIQTSNRAEVIAGYRKALEMAGDLERGRAVFKKTCATCHKAEGVGVDVGPNLATVTGRTPEDLLIHVLDPNREVAPPYINYNVALSDGRVLSGLIADESPSALTLKRAEGAADVVPRSQIEAVSSTGQSLMPEGLEKGLEPQDFADLIVFLRSIMPGGPAPAR
jgi:putative heme-binding domain-containing protein